MKGKYPLDQIDEVLTNDDKSNAATRTKKFYVRQPLSGKESFNLDLGHIPSQARREFGHSKRRLRNQFSLPKIEKTVSETSLKQKNLATSRSPSGQLLHLSESNSSSTSLIMKEYRYHTKFLNAPVYDCVLTEPIELRRESIQQRPPSADSEQQTQLISGASKWNIIDLKPYTIVHRFILVGGKPSPLTISKSKLDNMSRNRYTWISTNTGFANIFVMGAPETKQTHS